MSQNEQKSPTGPPTFKTGSQTWTLNLTLGLVDHVQEATQVDLLADGDESPVIPLLFNRRKLGGVLWACISKQADAAGVTREQFIDSLDSDALTAGWGALFNAILFFTPIQGRPAVQAQFDAQMEALEQSVAAMAEVAKSQGTNDAIQELVGRLKEEMQSELPKALANCATS
jgi:hypothetical protein